MTALDFVTDAAAALAKLKAEIRAEVIEVNIISGIAVLLITEYRAGRLGKLFGGRGGDDW